MRKAGLLLALAAFFAGCDTSQDPFDAGVMVDFYTPEGFPPPVYTLKDNPLSTERFLLGKKLFYDPLLSVDSTVSCGSCHQQTVAFAHADHQFSHGINDLLGNRNSPGLFNLAWHNELFWDGGSHNLELQPLGPITNPVEMNETLPNVIFKLRRSSFYPAMFKDAFGTDTIITDHLMKALAQFMAVMISDQSKYDQYRRGELSLSSSEMNGLNIFRSNCASCHTEPLLSDFSYRNNGLDSVYVNDPGRARITNNPLDSGKFKVPSLRNVMLTFPYMHDGRLNNMSKVLDHYASGVKSSNTLDPLLAGGIQLTLEERKDLLAFMTTLTDYRFIRDRRFSEN
jgi:cytochrome c peroxidase